AEDPEFPELREVAQRPKVPCLAEANENIGELLQRDEHRQIRERDPAEADRSEACEAADHVEVLCVALEEKRAQSRQRLEEAQGEPLAGRAEGERLEVGAEVGETGDIIDIPDCEMQPA